MKPNNIIETHFDLEAMQQDLMNSQPPVRSFEPVRRDRSLTMYFAVLLFLVLLLLCSCKKDTACPEWSVTDYYEAKVSGVTPAAPQDKVIVDCTQHTHGEIILLGEDTNVKHYRKYN